MSVSMQTADQITTKTTQDRLKAKIAELTTQPEFMWGDGRSNFAVDSDGAPAAPILNPSVVNSTDFGTERCNSVTGSVWITVFSTPIYMPNGCAEDASPSAAETEIPAAMRQNTTGSFDFSRRNASALTNVQACCVGPAGSLLKLERVH